MPEYPEDVPIIPITGVKEEGVMVHSHEVGFITAFGEDALAASKAWVIIDLSNTVNWKHTLTGRVDIEWLDLHLMADNAAEGVFEVGVITEINATNAYVLWLHRSFLDKAAEHHEDFNNYFPAHAKMSTASMSAGGTARTSGDTTFQTDVELSSLAGNVAPAVGDIVAKLTVSAGNVLNWNLIIGYHTH